MNFFNRFTVEQLILYGSAILLSLLLFAFCFVGFWGILNKAGESGWKAFIPFYNLYMFVKLAEMKGILFLLLLVPVVNLVFAFICYRKIAARFEKGIGFAIGLFLLPGVFSLILGFGPAQCKNPRESEEEPYYYYYKPKF
ncbi:MAG: signal peptidase I [Clostridia bacterium]|nr:signal peptidase I [Clostridia bacterium]